VLRRERSRNGRGEQAITAQAAWQKGKSGKSAVKEASTKRRAGQH